MAHRWVERPLVVGEISLDDPYVAEAHGEVGDLVRGNCTRTVPPGLVTSAMWLMMGKRSEAWLCCRTISE